MMSEDTLILLVGAAFALLFLRALIEMLWPRSRTNLWLDRVTTRHPKNRRSHETSMVDFVDGGDGCSD